MATKDKGGGPKTYHSPGGEVRTLLVLFTVPQQIIESPYAVGDQIVWLKKIQVIMVDASFDALPLVLLFPNKPSGQAAAS